jgi:hypothetical protein
MIDLPAPRPVLWPLRPLETADVQDERLPDGRRRVTIRHAELAGVTPAMMDWWYGHVDGTMEYAGAVYPRYLVWHPLDHISYEVLQALPDGSVGANSRLRITECFQRRPERLLRITVEGRRRDSEAAVIGNCVLGMSVLELVNRFEPTASGTISTSTMSIGTAAWPRYLGLNRVLTARILGGEMAQHWAQHHIEEVGTLEHFLPELYRSETAHQPQ